MAMRLRLRPAAVPRPLLLGVVVPLLMGQFLAAGIPAVRAQAQADPPACPTAGRPTPAATEGPYYKSGSPQRTSLLEPGMPGTRLVLMGYVCSRRGRPIARAWLDFWQADSRGVYDNSGFRLRGHQFADERGRYTLETVVPGEYPGRTPHIHVKVRAPNLPALTTQLYFPGEARNQTDALFRSEGLVQMRDGPGGRTATFNFVLDID
jgi:protocatechuate 3,4-dioxygenase beta subunit